MSDHEGQGSPQDLDDEARTGLKVWLDLGLSLGRQAEEQTTEMRKVRKALQSNTPVAYTVAASGLYVSGTPLVLNLGTPDMGTYWEVVSAYVGGVNYSTVAAGSAGLYLASVVTADGGGGPNVVDIATTLPNVGFYGTRQCYCNSQQYVLVIVNGGTVGQQYVANIHMNVFADEAAGGRVETIA